MSGLMDKVKVFLNFLSTMIWFIQLLLPYSVYFIYFKLNIVVSMSNLTLSFNKLLALYKILFLD